MSTPQPPYGAPPPVPLPYRRPVPSRRRPSGWWFVVGGLMTVAGIVIGVFLFVHTLVGLFSTDATIEVDGRPHEVTVPTDGDRMLWIDETSTEPTCEIVDVESGSRIALEGSDGTWTRDNGSIGDELGLYMFDPGSGRLQVSCSPEMPTVVQIGPAPEFGAFFGGLAAAVLVSVLLGGAGLVLLLVIGILYATGRPRNVPG